MSSLFASHHHSSSIARDSFPSILLICIRHPPCSLLPKLPPSPKKSSYCHLIPSHLTLHSRGKAFFVLSLFCLPTTIFSVARVPSPSPSAEGGGGGASSSSSRLRDCIESKPLVPTLRRRFSECRAQFVRYLSSFSVNCRLGCSPAASACRCAGSWPTAPASVRSWAHIVSGAARKEQRHSTRLNQHLMGGTHGRFLTEPMRNESKHDERNREKQVRHLQGNLNVPFVRSFQLTRQLQLYAYHEGVRIRPRQGRQRLVKRRSRLRESHSCRRRTKRKVLSRNRS